MAPVFLQGDSYFLEDYVYTYHRSAGSCQLLGEVLIFVDVYGCSHALNGLVKIKLSDHPWIL